jgi:cobalt-zinc-cadmium efflux system outer membrane protein
MLTVLLLALCIVDSGQAGPASSPPPLPIEQAVTVVLANAPQRVAAAVLAESSKEAAKQAGRWPNPVIDLHAENIVASGWHWRPPADPALAPGLDAFAVVTQPIELGGKRGARRAVAEGDADTAVAELSQVERGLAMETVRLYLGALRAREMLQALEENRGEMTEIQRVVAARVREGYAAEADLAKYQAESARLDSESVRLRIELTRNLAQLDALFGRAGPASGLEPGQLVMPAPRAAPAGSAAAVASRAVERSPDVQAARARETRAARALSFEQAQGVPNLDVVGGYKRTNGFDTAVLGVAMAIPLFDRNQRGVATATGGARAAASQRAAVEQRVAAEAKAIVNASQSLAERARRVDEELLAPAALVRLAARTSYSEGAANIVAMVDADRVYLDARREALQVKLDALAAAFEARVLAGEEVLR